MKCVKSEKGQAVVEFALCLSILLLMALAPVDYFRYIHTKIILSSAANESIGQLSYSSVISGTANGALMNAVTNYFGDRLDPDKVQIFYHYDGSVKKEDYTYYVYSSDRDDPTDYWNQFEGRQSNYEYAEVEVQLTYEITPVTFWGILYLGSTAEVKTPVYSRSIYAGGFTP